jgi:hypothetical protein
MSWDWETLKKQQESKRGKEPEKKKPKFRIKDLIDNPWAVIPAYVVIIMFLMIFFWYVSRWLHYKYGYENKVEQKIIEMVKPEALKDKYK